MPNHRLNGNFWQVLLIAVMGMYIAIKDVAAPAIKSLSGEKQTGIVQMVNADSQRISRLEEMSIAMRGIPESVATLREAVDGIKITIDRIEKKVDARINK